jgi:hypothetical protein
LADTFRIESILPLSDTQSKCDDERMFVVYCPRHRSQVLLFPDNIEALINEPDGIDMHWRCSCGEFGLTHIHQQRLRPTLTGAA